MAAPIVALRVLASDIQKKRVSRSLRDLNTKNFYANSRIGNIFNYLVVPRLSSVERGYNASVVVYGETGSGRSTTFFGNDKRMGLIEATATAVGGGLDKKKYCFCNVSFYEVYKNNLYDLLDPKFHGYKPTSTTLATKQSIRCEDSGSMKMLMATILPQYHLYRKQIGGQFKGHLVVEFGICVQSNQGNCLYGRLKMVMMSGCEKISHYRAQVKNDIYYLTDNAKAASENRVRTWGASQYLLTRIILGGYFGHEKLSLLCTVFPFGNKVTERLVSLSKQVSPRYTAKPKEYDQARDKSGRISFANLGPNEVVYFDPVTLEENQHDISRIKFKLNLAARIVDILNVNIDVYYENRRVLKNALKKLFKKMSTRKWVGEVQKHLHMMEQYSFTPPGVLVENRFTSSYVTEIMRNVGILDGTLDSASLVEFLSSKGITAPGSDESDAISFENDTSSFSEDFVETERLMANPDIEKNVSSMVMFDACAGFFVRTKDMHYDPYPVLDTVRRMKLHNYMNRKPNLNGLKSLIQIEFHPDWNNIAVGLEDFVSTAQSLEENTPEILDTFNVDMSFIEEYKCLCARLMELYLSGVNWSTQYTAYRKLMKTGIAEVKALVNQLYSIDKSEERFVIRIAEEFPKLYYNKISALAYDYCNLIDEICTTKKQHDVFDDNKSLIEVDNFIANTEMEMSTEETFTKTNWMSSPAVVSPKSLRNAVRGEWRLNE